MPAAIPSSVSQQNTTNFISTHHTHKKGKDNDKRLWQYNGLDITQPQIFWRSSLQPEQRAGNPGIDVNSCRGSSAPQLHRLLQSPSPAWLGIHAASGPHCHEVQGLKELYHSSPPKDDVNYSTKGKHTSVPPAPAGTKLTEHGCCPSMVPLNSFQRPLSCSRCSSSSQGPCHSLLSMDLSHQHCTR